MIENEKQSQPSVTDIKNDDKTYKSGENISAGDVMLPRLTALKWIIALVSISSFFAFYTIEGIPELRILAVAVIAYSAGFMTPIIAPVLQVRNKMELLVHYTRKNKAPEQK